MGEEGFVCKGRVVNSYGGSEAGIGKLEFWSEVKTSDYSK